MEIWERYFVVAEILKKRDEVLKNIVERRQLKDYFINLNLTVITFSAIYGATMGVYPGGWQIINNAVKIPILLLLSLYIAMPTYYAFNAFFGGKLDFSQVTALFLSGFAILSIVLLGLMPINLLYTLTTGNETFMNYAFIVLLNVGIYTVAGFCAVTYLYTGLRTTYPVKEWRTAFVIGSIILMLAGTQLSWIFRPYFHEYPGFIRPIKGNFYVAILELILRVLRGG